MKMTGKDWLSGPRSAAAIVRRITSVAACLIALTVSAVARGGHETGHDFASNGPGGPHSAPLAAGHRHGNDSHIKAASEERDRLLNTQLKSICRGC
jgi:hypothetical protein